MYSCALLAPLTMSGVALTDVERPILLRTGWPPLGILEGKWAFSGAEKTSLMELPTLWPSTSLLRDDVWRDVSGFWPSPSVQTPNTPHHTELAAKRPHSHYLEFHAITMPFPAFCARSFAFSPALDRCSLISSPVSGLTLASATSGGTLGRLCGGVHFVAANWVSVP